jgi:acyl transferase domain-containing protein
LIIEEFIGEAPVKGPRISFPQEYLIIFSAKTEWSLMKYTEKMQGFLQKNSSVEIADVARSLQKINHNLEHKAAIIASSIQDFFEKLNVLQQSRETLIDSNIYISSGIKFDADTTKSLIIQQALEKKDLKQLAQLWVAGATIDFRPLNGNSGTPGIDLPKYAFEHNIKFDFNNNYMINNENETVKFDDEFYRILLEKISKGECSEDEFKEAMI